jgi:glycosyltransferase involved in cell wall biosynthesis
MFSKGNPLRVYREKIVLIVGSAEIGGAEKQVVKLASELFDFGLAVEVWFLRADGPLIDHLNNRGIEWKDLGLGIKKQGILSFLWNLLSTARKFLDRDIKVVHLFLPEAIIIATHLILTRKVKIVVSSRGEINYKNGFVEYFLKRAFHRSDAITVNSLNQKFVLLQRFNLDVNKIHVTYNGIGESIDVANVATNPVHCVYLANFYDYKNHEDFILNVCTRKSSIHYFFVGDGPLLPAMKSLVSALLLDSKVEFMGKLTRPELILSKCQLAVHVSSTEGLSNAILEELSMGLPVIAFDVGGNSELIEDNKNGFLVPYSDWKLFNECLDILTFDVKKRISFSKNARKISRKYSWTHSRDSFLKVYNSL